MLLSDLGAVLRKARKEQGLTLKQLGARAGVHFTTLSSLERGRVSDLGVRKLLRVAETLGLELVLRRAGQSYTLDDVARERTSSLPESASSSHTDNREFQQANNSSDAADRSPPDNQLNRRGVSSLKELENQVSQYKLSKLAKEVDKSKHLLGSASGAAKQLAKEVDQYKHLLSSATEAAKLNKFSKEVDQYKHLLSSANEAAKLNKLAKELDQYSKLAKELDQYSKLAKELDQYKHVLGYVDNVRDSVLARALKGPKQDPFRFADQKRGHKKPK